MFPLPETVFFPGTSLPLHIFEPRYRAMVRDATAGEGLIVVSLMKEGGFHEIGTVGRVRDLEPLEDGRFNLRLEGLQRVYLTEVPGDTPYRRARAEPRPERPGTDDAAAIDEARLELLASYGVLRSMFLENEPLVMHQELSFEAIVNTACAELPIDARLRQRLLDEDLLVDRHRLGMEYIGAVIDALRLVRATKNSRDTFVN